MPKLVIIGHLEKADALDVGSLFGYSFSVGWSEIDRPGIGADGFHPLLPWTWRPIEFIKLFGKSESDDNWQSIGQFRCVSLGAPPSVDDVKAEAAARYKASSSIYWPDPSIHDKIPKLEVNEVESDEEPNESHDPWPAHIIEMASLPFPLAQTLNLSFVFRATQDIGMYSAFAAAPVLAKALRLDGELPPSEFQTPIRKTDGYAKYDQEAEPEPLDVIASSNVVVSTAYTVDKGQGIEILSTAFGDWQQEFLLRASTLFSAPDFVQFVLSPPQNPQSKLPEGFDDSLVPILVAAGVATIRDLISPGLEAGPLGGFPNVRKVVEATPTVREAVNDAFSDMQTWADFLKGIFAGVGQLSLWQLFAGADGKNDHVISDPQLYYGQLKRDFSTLLSPIANESISDGNQRAAPPGHKAAMIALWAAISKKLPGASPLEFQLEDASYTSRWLDDTLGMFWDNILTHSDSENNPMLSRTRALSRYFLLSRLGLPITSQETPDDLPNIWRDIPRDWMPRGQQLTKWNNAKPLFLRWIDTWQENRTGSSQPDLTVSDQNVHNPPLVHLQYSTFDRDNETDPEFVDLRGDGDLPNRDLFREIRGVGLLVRERNNNRWTCVNLNALVDFKEHQLVPTPVGFPLRSGYIANLRRGLIAYESEPLSGGTALDNIDGLQQTLSSELRVRRPLVSADYHPDVLTPQLKYGRVFSFAAFSVLNSGILPPVLRDEGADPRVWKSSSETIPDTWTPKDILYQRTTRIGELRIVGAELQQAQERWVATPTQPAVPPPIPEGTYPRARDIEWTSLWATYADSPPPEEPERLGLVLLSPGRWAAKSEVPQSVWAFHVRLPQVTWREWSTWGASLPARFSRGLPSSEHVIIPLGADQFRQHRADIIGECFAESLEDKAMPAVDDPCLSRILFFELIEESGDTIAQIDKRVLAIPKIPGDKGRALYQTEGATVTCRHGSTSELTIDESLQTVTATVREGTVCVLRVWACLSSKYQHTGTNNENEDFAAMFAPGVLPDAMVRKITHEGEDFLLVSPYDLLIEAASGSLPKPESLFSAFETAVRLYRSKIAVADVVASFPTSPPEASVAEQELFLNIGSVKALRQAWRWEGRPVPLHPTLDGSWSTGSHSGSDFDAAEHRWIWDVYAERPDVESISVRMPVRRKASVSLGAFDRLLARGCRYFESLDSFSASGGPTEPEADLRGSHFRYSLQVTSRYESLMKLGNEDSTRVAHPEINSTDPVGMQWENSTRSRAWKSTFVPSRTTEPSMPKLRLLLPLTESYGQEKADSPSLLAVFDDIFYDEVGLGDSLEAEIESVPVEDQPGHFAVQIGKDVLLRDGNEEAAIKPYRKTESGVSPVRIDLDAGQLNRRWSGPIGHFRDFDNRYARFLASSFIIPAPTSTDGGALDVRGWLARIRFRRTVHTKDFPTEFGDKVSVKDYHGYDVARWENKPISSGWTDGHWVQFLGSFSKFDGFGDRISRLVPSISRETGVMTLHEPNSRSPVALKPTFVPNFPQSRRLYTVVTQRAFDFRGQYNQELYVATLEQDDKDPTAWRSVSRRDDVAKLGSQQDDSLVPANDFRVRILEVAFPTAGPRAMKVPTDPEDLFRTLFEVGYVPREDVAFKDRRSPLDAIGSIVRVSEPANSLASNGQPLEPCELSELQRVEEYSQ